MFYSFVNEDVFRKLTGVCTGDGIEATVQLRSSQGMLCELWSIGRSKLETVNGGSVIGLTYSGMDIENLACDIVTQAYINHVIVSDPEEDTVSRVDIILTKGKITYSYRLNITEKGCCDSFDTVWPIVDAQLVSAQVK